MDGGKVGLRKEEGEGSHWLDYKAVRLHGSYYGAFFLDNQAWGGDNPPETLME